jgi:outer membrane protein insertion porin family
VRVSRRSTCASIALASGLALSFATIAQQPTPPPAPPPASSPLVAQDQPDPYDDRPIREIQILRADPADPNKTTPLTGPNLQYIRNQIRTTVGRPFRRHTVTNDITTLSALGRFKTIESKVQLQSDGSVIVFFIVGEQAVIQDVQIVGNRVITDQEAMSIAGALAQTAVDRFEIDRAARGIETLYREKGYYAARVEIDEKELAASNILVYRVIEGERVRVMGVQFAGNVAFTPKELRSAIRTTEYIPIFDKGPLDDDVRKDDETALADFYKDRGYLDVRTASKVQPAPNGKEAIVTFEIDEGPLYTLRSVRVRYTTPDALAEYRAQVAPDAALTYLTPEQMARIGRRCYSPEQLVGLMQLKPGDVFSDNKLKKSIDAIKAAYGKFGNLVDDNIFGAGAIKVRHDETKDEFKPEVDLILTINEGRPAKVGNINIGGNDHTKQQVIIRQLEIRPDRPLDASALSESIDRLESTRLFEPRSPKITIQPEREDEPSVRDVLVEVQETNTGAFTAGVAADSDAGLVGQFGISQRNFDILSPPGSLGELLQFQGFRGGGQSASLQLRPGSESQNYSVSLLEPYFLDSDYWASGSLYFRTRQYRVYDEQRVGFQPSLGRRFGSVWEGNVTLRVESVDISDIEASSPVDLFAVANQNLITSVAFGLGRDTRDSRTRPSRGSILGARIEQVGVLGGDYSFTKLNGNYSVFMNLYESFLGYKTILRLDSSVGYIPQGQDDAPIFERYYLGGQSFRGFSNRGVSPVGIRNDTGTLGSDAVGGAFSYFLGAEVIQPLFEEIVSGVLFVDTGTVETSPSFDHYRLSVGIGVRIWIPQVSPIPLAFDFGFPILKEETDRERIFTFSIDVPF